MSVITAASRRRLRGWSLALGVAILLWLPFEDTHTGWVQLFSAAMAVLGAARLAPWLASRLPARAGRAAWLPPLLGAVSGLSVPLLALALMAVKTGAHSHATPDFSGEQILTMLRLAWLWPLAGLLGGLGLALLRAARRG